LLFLHVNIRYLHKNFNLLYKFIESLHILLHVICLTDTRIKNEHLTNPELTSYSIVHADSITNTGRVAMYVLNILKFKLCQKQYQLTNSKSIFISINNLTPPLIIGVIYRHPSTTRQDAFVEDLSLNLTSIITFWVIIILTLQRSIAHP